jgi:NADH:ubiquinone oxidoreductase subunit 6 (subunit J)
MSIVKKEKNKENIKKIINVIPYVLAILIIILTIISFREIKGMEVNNDRLAFMNFGFMISSMLWLDSILVDEYLRGKNKCLK